MIHETAIVEDGVTVHETAKVWHWCHVRSGAWIGKNVVLGKGVYIDRDVVIPEGCHIQNGVSIYRGVHLREHVFVGPHVVFTNDDSPRAGCEFTPVETWVDVNASICAGAVIRCGVTINRFALIACGAVVVRDVEEFELYKGFGKGKREYVDIEGKRRP